MPQCVLQHGSSAPSWRTTRPKMASLSQRCFEDSCLKVSGSLRTFCSVPFKVVLLHLEKPKLCALPHLWSFPSIFSLQCFAFIVAEVILCMCPMNFSHCYQANDSPGDLLNNCSGSFQQLLQHYKKWTKCQHLLPPSSTCVIDWWFNTTGDGGSVCNSLIHVCVWTLSQFGGQRTMSSLQ